MPNQRKSHRLTFEKAARFFSYNPDTGEIRVKVKRPYVRKEVGEIATNWLANGYTGFHFEKELYMGHRVAWLLTYGEWPKDQLDHIDRDKRNNRIANLRECDTAENHQNQDTVTRKGTSRYLGVCKPTDREGWRAQITVNGKQNYLGMYRCETAAYVAYCRAKPSTHTFVSADRK
jgi:hypothetical protein